jgi:predicted nicotinamide N-methyase
MGSGEAESLFDWRDSGAYFRDLPVQRHAVNVAGRAYEIMGVEDAADLLDQSDFARRFLEDDVAPYGLELWPAARMLAEHLLQGQSGAGRSAIELGCGLGLVSIAAADRGWAVLATDNDPTSLRFAAHNAAVNHATFRGFELLDWRNPPSNRRFDRVFAADVLYQLCDHEPLLRCIDTLLAPDGIAIIADPNRGVADRFASVATRDGFRVRLDRASAPNRQRKPVSGRLFTLRRDHRPGTSSNPA